MTGPWTFEQAQDHLRTASLAQQEVERLLRDAFARYAVAEEKYRKALALQIVSAHNDGVAWSAAADLARGDKAVAAARRERDVAEGMKEAVVQAGWRRASDRRDAQRFADWSMRRELAEFHGETPEAAIPR